MIDKNEVVRLYVDEKLPGTVIAHKLGVHKVTIYNVLRNAGIPIRLKVLDKDKVYKLHHDDKLTYKAIAIKLGTSESSVCRAMRRSGVVKRRRDIPISKRKLSLLYLKENYTLTQLAKYFGCSKTTISHRVQKYKIRKHITWSERELEILDTNIGIKSYEELSKILRRSITAIKCIRRAKKLSAGYQNYYSASLLSQELGVDVKFIKRCYKEGKLLGIIKERKGCFGSRCFVFIEERIVEFLEKYYSLFDDEKIPNIYFRNIIKEKYATE